MGAPKTGTTYLQELLHEHRDGLRSIGLLYPGLTNRDQFLAVMDVRGVRVGGYNDPHIDGAWQQLVAEVQSWSGNALISHELLANADENQVRDVVESFRGVEIHVIVTARDLARQVPSMWQEHIKNRNTTSWNDYLVALQRLTGEDDGSSAPLSALGTRFWRSTDAADILRRWGSSVPVERLHLVTVPASGADGELLWRRFAGLVGIDTEVFSGVARRANASLGVAETELLRRLNHRLLEQMTWPRYRTQVKGWFAQETLVSHSVRGPLTLPVSEWPWAEQWSRRLVERLRAGGYDIVGDLEELLSPPPTTPLPQCSPAALVDADLIAAALPAIRSCVLELARLFEKRSHPPARDPSAQRLRLGPAIAWRRGRRAFERLRHDRRLRQARDVAGRTNKPPTAYVHIGLPKTGTTFLQTALAANRSQLAADGVLYPEGRFAGHFFAALDLLQTGFRGHRYDAATGKWELTAQQVRRWPGVSILSHEVLQQARRRHMRRLVESLQPAQVHIVITVRDLARQLPAMWQERIKLGHSQTWVQFLAAVKTADSSRNASDGDNASQDAGLPCATTDGGASTESTEQQLQPGRTFWRGHDGAAVASRWTAVAPPERIHLITIPREGFDHGVLWQRFGDAIGIDCSRYPLPERRANDSLGPAEAELLRRLNPVLTDDLSWEAYERHAKWDLAEQVLASRPGRIRMRLPAEQWDWARSRSERLVDELKAGGYAVTGDLADLLPAGTGNPSARDPDDTNDSELLEAGLDALAGLLELRARRSGGRH